VPEEVILLLGSNVGRRVRRLRDGVAAIARGVTIGRMSRMYAGEPSGRANQPWYLNIAVRGETDFAPDALLQFVKRIEAEAGRKAGARWGPRELDIDIILMGNRVVREPHLAIPHPQFVKRIEAEAGRKTGARWGPRELDIDIILMGNRVVREPHLAIPHPQMSVRRFCLVPVAEIAPEVPVPPGGETVRDLLEACRDPLEVSPL